MGLISDTHGLLRPEAVTLLRGCAHIIHAGDIGRPEILAALAALAPLTAVRGNNDQGEWAEALQDTALVRIGKIGVYVIHDLAELDVDPQAIGAQVVVCGHSHRPRIDQRSGVLHINPGSAGPRRFRLPIAIAELIIAGAQLQPHIIELS